MGGVEQGIELLADFCFDALLEGSKQEAQRGPHFKLVGIHQQGAFHAGTAEIQGVLRIAFFIAAVHVEFFFGLFGPGHADLAGFLEAQVVFAVDVDVRHRVAPWGVIVRAGSGGVAFRAVLPVV